MKLENYNFIKKDEMRLLNNWIYIFFGMNEKVTIHQENPFSESANQLLNELTKEIAKRYDFTMDGKGAFSPDEVNNIKSGFFVARINGKPAGCGALRPLFKTEIAEVKRMFVKPEFRGKGIAKLILKKLEQFAVELGYKKIWLETGDRQPEAIKLYKNSGYSKIKNYGIDKENLHSNCFEKKLHND